MADVSRIRFFGNTTLAGLACGVLAGLVPAVALAQAAPAQAPAPAPAEVTGLTEIIVTATRRAERSQEAPLAVSVVGEQQLKGMGINSADQLSRVVPNITLNNGFSPGNLRVSIRGLGTVGAGSATSGNVGSYVDDVYQVFTYGVGTQLFDVDRVEVLRGPQGTLFGRNATGGAVNTFSVKPRQEQEGYVRAEAGDGQYNRFMFEGAYNTPLSDTVALRASLRAEKRNPYVRNAYDNSELGENKSLSARLQLAFRPTDDTEANLKLFAVRQNGDGGINHSFLYPGICADPFYGSLGCPSGVTPLQDYRSDKVTASEVKTREQTRNWGATLQVNHKIGSLSLTSISGFADIDYELDTNDEGGLVDFFHTYQPLKAWQASQELRLATDADKPLSAIFGGFFGYDHFNAPLSSGATLYDASHDSLYVQNQRQNSWTGAVFTSLTYKFNEQFSATGGLRYTHDNKSTFLSGAEIFGHDLTNAQASHFDPQNPPFALDPMMDTTYGQYRKNDWSKVTWDATLNYHPSRDLLLFAKAATGYRAGGYGIGSNINLISTVNPEVLTSYEAGFKSEWLGHTLRINGAAYHYKYDNLQVFVQPSAAPGLSLTNAAKASVDGFELEIQAAPVRDLLLQAAFGYSDAAYKNFKTSRNGVPIDLSGGPLPYAPKITASLSGSYVFEVGANGGLTLQTDWNYRSKVAFDSYGTYRTAGDEALWLGNARVTYTPDRSAKTWSLYAYVNNLTDEDSRVSGYDGDTYGVTVFGDRRTYGVGMGWDF